MRVFLFALFCLIFVACEDQIDLNLEDDSGHIVIIADLNTFNQMSTVRVFRTTSLSDTSANLPVTDAQVVIKGGKNNRSYTFVHSKNGLYVNDRIRLREGNTYQLEVKDADSNSYVASSTVPEYVKVDSIGTGLRQMISGDYYFVSVTFTDPANVANNYLYKLSVNKKSFEFSTAEYDKYNDGLVVQHELFNTNKDLKPGDTVRVLRQCVDLNVYNYWRDVASNNPSQAAPYTPVSNFSNGALGYFSASSAAEYEIIISEIEK